MYNKNRMDNFDLKKYLVENKLSEEASSNQLSAVEWLEDQIKSEKYIEDVDFSQAKAMEKEQIKNAFNYGQTDPGMEADEYLDFINFK
jgi:hypothetical protein